MVGVPEKYIYLDKQSGKDFNRPQYRKLKKGGYQINSSDYNRYLSTIKAANDCESFRARDLLRQIQADMIAQYGLSDEDVNYLIRQFRYYV